MRPTGCPPGIAIGTGLAAFSPQMDWSATRISRNCRTGPELEELLFSRRRGSLWLGALCSFILFCLVCFCAQSPAGAAPLNLFDSRPREVMVSFEISPREAPAQLKTTYSQGFRAFVEPGLRESELRVVVPAHTVEEFLLGDQNPIPESFSDFVWTFDIETGHVVSARLSGRVTPRINWGFMINETQADIEIEMGTARIGGFKRPLRVLGQLVFRYCSKPEDSSCQLVEAMPLDRSTGYVNAVGEVWVRSSFIDLWNFSPMGEAIFLELDPDRDLFADGQAGAEFSLPVSSGELPVMSVPVSVESPSPGNVN